MVAFLTLASVFFTAALTFLTTALSFLGPVFLVLVLVTPAGLAPGVLVVVFARGLRVMVGAVSIGWKTRGLELPVDDRVPSRAILQVCALMMKGRGVVFLICFYFLRPWENKCVSALCPHIKSYLRKWCEALRQMRDRECELRSHFSPQEWQGR